MSPALRRTLAAVVVGFAVTATVVVVPSLRLAYRSQAAHLVVETTVALVAFFVSLLLFGRYRRSKALADLLLVHAMGLLGFTAFLLVTVPALAGAQTDSTAASWAALMVRMCGALLILAAATVPSERVRASTDPWRELVIAVVGVGALTLIAVILASRLPDAVDVRVLPEQSSRPVLDGHPLVLAVQGVDLVCYSAAAIVFTRRAARRADDLLGWFGAAAALGAWARVAYLLFPSLYTEWFYAGDLLRLGMYVVLLVGVVGEIRRYWEAQAAAAVDAERRRLARDLHDGVVQELGFIRAECLRHPGQVSTQVSAAADRALDEARRAISALAASPDESLASALSAAARDLGDRFDVDIRLALDETVIVHPEKREALLRIAREALTNAARHSGATAIDVTLASGRLDVRDGGRGFDPSHGRHGGYGLTSMRDRAEAAGANLRIDSAPGAGTRVGISW